MATTLKSSSSTSSDSSSKTLTDASYHLSELQDSLDSFEPFTTLTLTSPYKSSSELQDRVNVLEKQNLALRLALAKERSSNATLKEKAERRSRAFAELDAQTDAAGFKRPKRQNAGEDPLESVRDLFVVEVRSPTESVRDLFVGEAGLAKPNCAVM